MTLKKQIKRPNKATSGSFILNSGVDRDSNRALDKVSNIVDTETSESEQRIGNSGTMRIVKTGKNYRLELKTKDGWIVSDNSSATGFSFKKS